MEAHFVKMVWQQLLLFCYINTFRHKQPQHNYIRWCATCLCMYLGLRCLTRDSFFTHVKFYISHFSALQLPQVYNFLHLLTLQMYANCSCAGMIESPANDTVLYRRAPALRGKCDKECYMVYIFLPILGVFIFFTFMLVVPTTSLIFR